MCQEESAHQHQELVIRFDQKQEAETQTFSVDRYRTSHALLQLHLELTILVRTASETR